MVLRSQYEFEVNSRKQMRRYKYLKTIDIVSHYFPSYNQHFNGTDDKYNRVFRRINIKPTAVQLKYYNSINKINKAEESFDSKVFFADEDKEDSFDAYDKWAFSHESSSNRKDADAPNVANEPEVLDVQEYEKTPEVTATSEVLEVHEAASGTEPPPSFREFVVFAALQQLRCDKERSCLAGIDGHIVLQAVRCNPCMHDFDAVLKLEMLQEEFAYVRQWFGLPNVDKLILDNIAASIGNERVRRLSHGVLVVSNKTGNPSVVINASGSECQSFQEYMAQLTPLELDLLYTIYYEDFALFGYEAYDVIE